MGIKKLRTQKLSPHVNTNATTSSETGPNPSPFDSRCSDSLVRGQSSSEFTVEKESRESRTERSGSDSHFSLVHFSREWPRRNLLLNRSADRRHRNVGYALIIETTLEKVPLREIRYIVVQVDLQVRSVKSVQFITK